jgi:hypothetical protein
MKLRIETGNLPFTHKFLHSFLKRTAKVQYFSKIKKNFREYSAGAFT